ncbi:MAG: hypothetical protein H8D26_08395 [Methanomicrobia archaeon]|nr:hypothetical protein [Methanomicrobia archaeon]
MLETKPILLTRHFFRRWAERVLEAEDISQAKRMSKDVINEIEKVIFNKDYVCIYDGEERGKPKYRVICELFGTLVTLIVLDTEVNVIKTVWMPKSWEKEIYKKRGEMR